MAGDDENQQATTSGRWWPRKVTHLVVVAALVLTASVWALAGISSAADPAVQVTVRPVEATVSAGGRVAFRVDYSCSALVEQCTGLTVSAAVPAGTAPGGGPAPVVAGSGRGERNADVASVTGTGPVVFTFHALPGGTSGQTLVSWQVPNLVTLPGTTFDQVLTVTADGTPATQVTSAPVSVQAAADLSAVLQVSDPSDPSLVAVDDPVTYQVYDCNPGTTALGGLDYATLSLVLTLPAGVSFGSATGGGTWAPGAHTVTWQAPNPTRNECAEPDRTYSVTVTYPAAVFRPAASNPPTVNTVPMSLQANAVSLSGTPVSGTDTLEHTFTGPPSPNTQGRTAMNSGLEPQFDAGSQHLASDNVTSPYGFQEQQYFYLERPGETPYPYLQSMLAFQDRLPCVGPTVARSPAVATTDPLNGYQPGSWSVPADQCHEPAFATRWFDFDAYSASRVAQVEVVTWDGTTGRVRTWTPPGSLGSFALAVHSAGDVEAVASSAGGTTTPDLDPTGPATGPVLPGTTRPGHAGQVSDPNSILSMGVPDDEVVTDFRVVYRDVDYYNQVNTSFFGRSTAAFAASGFTTMTNDTRSFSLGAPYPNGTGASSTSYTWAGTVRTFVQQFVPPAPDPTITLTPVTDVDALHAGDTPTWQVKFRNGTNGTPLNPYVALILPPGHTLVPSSVQWTGLGALDGVAPTMSTSTTTIAGHPRTRVVFTWPAANRLDNPLDAASPDHPFYLSGDLPTLRYDTDLAQAVADGTHSGDDASLAYLLDGTQTLTPTGSDVPLDEFDVDGDGDTTEMVAKASVGWTAIGTSSAQASLAVRGGADDTFGSSVRIPIMADDETPTTLAYRIRMTNHENLRLRDLTVYDVLPYKGDSAISAALNGIRRGTDWVPTFNGMTTVPAGVTVSYSQSTNPCRPELFPNGQGACTDDWNTQPPSELSGVKAIRLQVADPYEQLDIDNPPLDVEFQMTATPASAGAAPLHFRAAGLARAAAPVPAGPVLVGTADNNVAWVGSWVNAAGEQAPLLPAEAPVASAVQYQGQLRGLAWHDSDRDGIRSPGEKPRPGVTARLLTSTGDTVRAPDGDAVTTTTDNRGRYGFAVPIGSYRVAFSGAKDLTKRQVGTDPKVDSDPARSDGTTSTLALTTQQPGLAHIDAGYVTARPEPEPEPSDGAQPASGSPGGPTTGAAGGPDLPGTGSEIPWWLPGLGALLTVAGVATVSGSRLSRRTPPRHLGTP